MCACSSAKTSFVDNDFIKYKRSKGLKENKAIYALLCPELALNLV